MVWLVSEENKPKKFTVQDHSLALEQRDMLHYVLDYYHREGGFPTENRLRVDFEGRKTIVQKILDLGLFEEIVVEQRRIAITFGGFLYCNNETMKSYIGFMDKAFPILKQHFRDTYGEKNLDFEELIKSTNPTTWSEFRPTFQKAIIIFGKAGRYLISPTIQTVDNKTKIPDIRVNQEILDYQDLKAFMAQCFLSLTPRVISTDTQNVFAEALRHSIKPFDRRPRQNTKSVSTVFISEDDIKRVSNTRLKTFIAELNKCYIDCPNAAGGLIRAIISNLIDIYYISNRRFSEIKELDFGSKLGKFQNEPLDRNTRDAIKHLRANAKLLGDAALHSLSVQLQSSDIVHSQAPLKILIDFVLRETPKRSDK